MAEGEDKQYSDGRQWKLHLLEDGGQQYQRSRRFLTTVQRPTLSNKSSLLLSKMLYSSSHADHPVSREAYCIARNRAGESTWKRLNRRQSAKATRQRLDLDKQI